MKFRILFLCAGLLTNACTSQHFISDSADRHNVQTSLEARRAALPAFPFETAIATTPDVPAAQEAVSAVGWQNFKEAMSFLYAYMPLGDILEYDSQLFASGVATAFRARSEMPWGSKVPDRLFRHFVLPLRVNNETLDSSRTVFYEALKNRVKRLSMTDAVLEVNHWCHEKVQYTPSDGRTSAPLATIRTAYGRCGEESVLTAAALRAVGIPARQVYTPRWAHTDDNHAWVEAWADGRWHYLGACEPEPVLDRAWFSGTVRRALLLHTKVFGAYSGPEDVIRQTPCFTEINVTSGYTPVRRVNVRACKDGRPVPGARIAFCIYNYAEFYPAIDLVADAQGIAGATLGLGDILVQAFDGQGHYGFAKIPAASADTLIDLPLDRRMGDTWALHLDIIPPPEANMADTVDPAAMAANAVRLSYEDSLRNAYVATFPGPEQALYLREARGNAAEIQAFVQALHPGEERERGMLLLQQVNAKDLRDTPAATLLDHMGHTPSYDSLCTLYHAAGISPFPPELYAPYVLNPRIGLECLRPWRSTLAEALPSGYYTGKPEAIMDFCHNIEVLDDWNPQNIAISPLGALRYGAADTRGRQTLFVAACRTSGIPARFEEITGQLQYYQNGAWHPVPREQTEEPEKPAASASLQLAYKGPSFLDNPKFENHFTLSRFTPQGLQLLNFTDKEGTEGSVSWANSLATPTPLPAGDYLITSGTRMASGKVLVHLRTLTLLPGSLTRDSLILRYDPTDFQVIGALNPDAPLLRPHASDSQAYEACTLLDLTGRGFFALAFLRPGHEPSNHLIRDLAGVSWKHTIVLLCDNTSGLASLKADPLPLPATALWAIDGQGSLCKEICKNLKISNLEYPLLVIADSFGRIVHSQTGYRVGALNPLFEALPQ